MPTKAKNSFASIYHPAPDDSPKLDNDDTMFCQEMVGMLCWVLELGCVDINLEVSLMSSHTTNPGIGHMNALIHIFAYLKQKPKLIIHFYPRHHYINEDRFIKCDCQDTYPGATEDFPVDLPPPLGNYITTTCFVDARHGSNLLNRSSHTGILLFLNLAQSTGTVSGSEFIALKTAVEIIIAFRFKLRCFGIPIDGPTNVLCDNETMCNNTRSHDSRLNKKHNAIAFHKSREAVAASFI